MRPSASVDPSTNGYYNHRAELMGVDAVLIFSLDVIIFSQSSPSNDHSSRLVAAITSDPR
jgi:predicted regulator of Ras-like GTPase activity (Roadblock/LC7/MglB family)